MKKAIIFDMDGLMFDSERVTWEGYRQVCKERGFNMELSFYKTMLGYPMEPVREMLKAQFGSEFPVGEVVKNVHDYVESVFKTEGVPKKKGLHEVLKYAAQRGYKMLVATSSERDRVEKILDYAGIAEYFDDLVCGSEVNRGKPNPDIFLEGCRKLNVAPYEAYVIEDSEMGVLAAFRAGIEVICVPDMKFPQEMYHNMAFAVVDDLLEAKKVMEMQE